MEYTPVVVQNDTRARGTEERKRERKKRFTPHAVQEVYIYQLTSERTARERKRERKRLIPLQ
jgi:hypothetical protein